MNLINGFKPRYVLSHSLTIQVGCMELSVSHLPAPPTLPPSHQYLQIGGPWGIWSLMLVSHLSLFPCLVFTSSFYPLPVGG